VNVVILESAEQDLKELRSYIIRRFSLGTWKNTYSQIKDSIRNLEKFPYLGNIPSELESLNLTQYRQIVSGMNRIIYEVRQDVIYVHLIADSRREMQALLSRRLLRAS
jgi:toxin ParE1/3/4